MGVIPDEGRPSLRSLATAWRADLRAISSDRARRDTNPKRQPEFIRDPFFAPRGIRPGHRDNQLPEISRNRRPTSRARMYQFAEDRTSLPLVHDPLRSGSDKHSELMCVFIDQENEEEDAKDGDISISR